MSHSLLCLILSSLWRWSAAGMTLMLHFMFALAVRQHFQAKAKPSQCDPHQDAVVLLIPLSGAEVSGTVVTAEVAQEAGRPWTMVVQPNSECFWEELAALRGA